MAGNNQLSGNTKNSSTGTSSTNASSEAIGKHENEIVPHKISNHDKLVQTMVMVDGEWVNVNDTNDQANMKDDMNKVNKKVVEAQKGIVEAKSAADSAAKAADSAVSASVVNSDAITAQSAAISEAKSAISSATAEIQQTAATAASDAAKIRADVAQVQSEVDTAKAANSATVEALKSDVSAAKQDIQAARQANENVAKQLDDYTKQAQAQGKTIKDIQNAQDGYTATLADVKGNVSKISDAVDGLSASLKDDQGNVASVKAQADQLSDTLTDHAKSIATLNASAKELSSTLEDADGRLSKVEQTASTLTNEFSDQDGRLSKVEQTATGTQQTVANQQGQINDIKTDVSGVHETITGQGNQIATINTSLNGLNTKYESVSGDLGKLKDQVTTNSTQITQNKQAITLKADQTEVDNVKNTAQQNSSRLDVMNNEIQSKVTSTDVNNIVDGKGYATTSSVQSMITQSAGSINETITNLTSKVNSNNGGGINLVSGTIEDIVLDDTANTGTQGWKFSILPLNTELKVGDKITVSADVTLTGTGSLSQWGMSLWSKDVVDMRSNDYSADVGKGSTATLTVKSIADTSKPTALLIYCGRIGDTEGKKAIFHHLKVERGDIATPWSPAPSDNATVTQVQQITATLDGLQSTVANKADTSQVTQLSNVIQSKVSTSDFTSKVSQLSNDINLRVTKGDVLSQINVEAGRTLIQSNKIYFDADSFVMSPNSKAFIPSAFITDLSADKITTGTLDAGNIRVINLTADNIHGGTLDVGDMHVKNFSANDIEAGTLSGVTIRAGDTTDFFQTSQDNIYWITDNGEQSALIGKGRYVTFPGFNIFDNQAIYLGTYAGSYLQNGTIVEKGGSFGHPKFNIERPADSAFDLDSKSGDMGSTGAPLDNSRISGWVDQHEYFYLEQNNGFYVRLNQDNNASQFQIQKNEHIGAYFGKGNNGNQITFALGGADGGFNVNGNFHVTGSKNSIVETRQGYLAINAYETAEYYFGDIGENNTGDTSQVVIGIDRIFNEVVNTDIQYQVFVTPYSNAHVWVEKRYNNRFIVRSDRPNAEFGWELKAKRKGYESNRLRRVNVDFNQMDLKGEN